MTVAEAWAKVRKSVEFHAPHLDPEVAVVAQALERPMTPEIRAAVERLRAFHEASVAHRVYHDTGQCYGDSHAIHEVTRRDCAEWLESGGAGLLVAAADAGARAMRDALKKYEAEHVEGECRKWVGSDRGHGWSWVQSNPCTCGLDALLQAEAPRAASEEKP